jgi:hypothetical protein
MLGEEASEPQFAQRRALQRTADKLYARHAAIIRSSRLRPNLAARRSLSLVVDHMSTRGQSGAVSRKLVIWISIPVILVGLFIGWRSATRHKYERARADWMATTLPRLASLSLTNVDISRELETLKASRGT